jgi:hypothetical protein
MANTVIQLKYSTVNNIPASLNVGEPAYSFTSDRLFIGNATTGVITIGGKRYVDLIEANTSAAQPGTIVVRDLQGSAAFNVVTADAFVGPIQGNAATASKLQTARDIGLAGDLTGNVSFDGSTNVTLTAELTNTGVSAGTYGGTTKIPVITVDEDGRVTSAANANVATTLSFDADSGSGTLDLLSNTFRVTGGTGITTTANDVTNAIVVDVDNTVIRTTGNQAINGDFTVTGNLNIVGNVVSVNVSTFRVDDSLLQLAANNEVSDAIDIGFYGHYSDDAGVSKRHAGLFRDSSAADRRFILFQNLIDPALDDSTGVTINTAAPTFAVANLEVNLVGGTISGLTQDISVADGGTGASSFTTGNILVGNGTGALQTLANTGTAGTYANASHIPVITTDEYGRISNVVNTKIDIDASQITSGTLPIARGGTNASSYTYGGILQFDGASFVSLANTTYTQSGTLTTANTVSAITVDAFGRLTALTSSAIAIGASQITSGTLGVERGGTGAGTFTQNGVLLGQGTSAFSTASSSTEGHLLTINNAGVPTFMMLSGGTF